MRYIAIDDLCASSRSRSTAGRSRFSVQPALACMFSISSRRATTSPKLVRVLGIRFSIRRRLACTPCSRWLSARVNFSPRALWSPIRCWRTHDTSIMLAVKMAPSSSCSSRARLVFSFSLTCCKWDAKISSWDVRSATSWSRCSRCLVSTSLCCCSRTQSARSQRNKKIDNTMLSSVTMATASRDISWLRSSPSTDRVVRSRSLASKRCTLARSSSIFSSPISVLKSSNASSFLPLVAMPKVVSSNDNRSSNAEVTALKSAFNCASPEAA